MPQDVKDFIEMAAVILADKISVDDIAEIKDLELYLNNAVTALNADPKAQNTVFLPYCLIDAENKASFAKTYETTVIVRKILRPVMDHVLLKNNIGNLVDTAVITAFKLQ